MNPTLRHEPEHRRFVAELDDGQGVLEYRRIGETTLDYCHTYVPAELRSRGVASDLVEFALEYARERSLKVIPSCPFVANVIRDNPDHAKLLAG